MTRLQALALNLTVAFGFGYMVESSTRGLIFALLWAGAAWIAYLDGGES